ncbi:protein APEM9 isoform X3 [Aristolochia californica]
MDGSLSHPSLWEQIDLSESYLVGCMFEEAASLASSIMRNLCEISQTTSTESTNDSELEDMLEYAATVYVQVVKELGRTAEIFNDFRDLFGSVSAIPAEVLVVGACFQIAEGYLTNVRLVLEEFLSKWEYVDNDAVYRCTNNSSTGWCGLGFLTEEEYAKIADLYAVTLLGKYLREFDFAVSWVEKAELPEEKRQAFLRCLDHHYGKCSCKSSIGAGTPLVMEGSDCQLIHDVASNMLDSEISTRTVEVYPTSNGDCSKTTIVESKRTTQEQKDPWFFKRAVMNFSNTSVVLYVPLILFVFYILRRKGSVLKRFYRFVRALAPSIRNALLNFWQLAFSVQVNPLASVQSLQVPARGNT